MKNKKRSGFTLLELILAVTLLIIVFVPITGIIAHSIRVNVQTHIVTAATMAAHLRMEELVGLNATEISNLNNHITTRNGLTVRLSTSPHPDHSALWIVEVFVYNLDDVFILSHENHINVADGGFSF